MGRVHALVTGLLLQQDASLDDIIAHAQLGFDAAPILLGTLVVEGFVTVDNTADPATYTSKAGGRKPCSVLDQSWKALDNL